MPTKEQIFEAAAQNNMVEFGLSGFKNTYPSLYKAIMEAMEAYRSARPTHAQSLPFSLSGSGEGQERPWPLGGYAPGNYLCRCYECEKEFRGDKRAVQCLECALSANHAYLTTLKKQVFELESKLSSTPPSSSPSIGVGQVGELGINLIAKERKEQIEKHNRTVAEDIKYNSAYQLLDAACRLLQKWPENRVIEDKHELEAPDNSFDSTFRELIPDGWNKWIWYKMFDKPYKDRLVIAGALIAAEIDRLNNLQPLPAPKPVEQQKESDPSNEWVEAIAPPEKEGYYNVITEANCFIISAYEDGEWDYNRETDEMRSVVGMGTPDRVARYRPSTYMPLEEPSPIPASKGDEDAFLCYDNERNGNERCVVQCDTCAGPTFETHTLQQQLTACQASRDEALNDAKSFKELWERAQKDIAALTEQLSNK
jgi:hypothetical protein